jgi:hypothetical protein
MNNKLTRIETYNEMSVMTMGQDQRHRTIDRSEPLLTGCFYLPPLLKQAGLEPQAMEFNRMFIDLANACGTNFATFIAPYGAMVGYCKSMNMNALFHEQAKRLCWCAQEEIYNMNIQLMHQLSKFNHEDIVSELKPHCAKYGKCCEGARYCGRDLAIWKAGDGFSQRTI